MIELKKNIRISYPFRLTTAPKSCGYDDPNFELQCHNNQTILNVRSRWYIVQDINYDYYSIRLVDPSISSANHSSCPVYNNDYDSWPNMFSGSLEGISVLYFSCLAPVNSPKYVEGPFCGNGTNIFSNSSQIYTYVMAGNRITMADVAESFMVNRVSWVSGRRGKRDNSSLAEIYDASSYGIELSWFRVSCGDYECHNPIFGRGCVTGYVEYRR